MTIKDRLKKMYDNTLISIKIITLTVILALLICLFFNCIEQIVIIYYTILTITMTIIMLK